MDKLLLQLLIRSHREKALSDKSLVNRDVMNLIDQRLSQKGIIYLTGLRRSGKSSILDMTARALVSDRRISENQLLILNFEDERFFKFGVEDFEPLYQAYLEMDDPKGTKYLFMDEIQVIPGWERWIHRMYEFEDVRFMITGSNATLSRSDFSTALTGRGRELRVHPFSFREYLRMKGLPEIGKNEFVDIGMVTTLKRHFHVYSTLGGFPEVLIDNETGHADGYFKDIIHRDVITRHQIRNPREIRELCLYLISNSGTILSYEALRRMLNLKSVSTVRNYLEILREVYLVHSISRYDYSVKRQIYNPDKYYVTDLGFYRAIGFQFSENLGRVLENLVLHQLMRCYDELYYWSSEKSKEVDFLVKKHTQLVEAIQVTYDLNAENRERELAGLVAAGKELGITNLTILTHDQEDRINPGQFEIRVLPVWKWLLLK